VDFRAAGGGGGKKKHCRRIHRAGGRVVFYDSFLPCPIPFICLTGDIPVITPTGGRVFKLRGAVFCFFAFCFLLSPFFLPLPHAFKFFFFFHTSFLSHFPPPLPPLRLPTYLPTHRTLPQPQPSHLHHTRIHSNGEKSLRFGRMDGRVGGRKQEKEGGRKYDRQDGE